MASILSRDGAAVATEIDFDPLIAQMVTAQMRATPHRPANLKRACESAVRAAIRRDGYTDADQRLSMTASDRAIWEAGNPLPQ